MRRRALPTRAGGLSRGGAGLGDDGGGVGSRAGMQGQITNCPSMADTAAAVSAYTRGRAPEAARPSLQGAAVRERLFAMHPHTAAAFSEQRRCVRCNRYYRESQNAGTWGCRVHIGLVDTYTGRWTCCNELERVAGCRRSDHAIATDAPTPYRVTVVPMFLTLDPAPRIEAVATAPPASHYTVEHARAEADRQSPEAEDRYRRWEAAGNAWTIHRADDAVFAAAPL